MAEGLGWKAPDIRAPEGSSLYPEDVEERQRERHVTTIRKKTELAQEKRERAKSRIRPMEQEPAVSGTIQLVQPEELPGLREELGLDSSPLLGPAYENPDSKIRSVTNFLLGEDMAIYGIQWDKEGFDWNFQNFKDQWSEEPLWSTVTLGFQALTLVAPYSRAIKLGGWGGKVAARGAERSRFGIRPGFKYYPEVGTIKGYELAEQIRSGEKAISVLDESRPWFSAPEFTSMGEVGARKFEMDMFRDFDVIGPRIYEKYGDDSIRALVGKHGEMAHMHMTDAQLETLYRNIPGRQLAIMRRDVQKYNTTARLGAKAELAKETRSEVKLTKVEEGILAFNRVFANDYYKKAMGLTPEEHMTSDIAKRLNAWNLPENIGQLLSNPPPIQAIKLFFHHWIKQDAVRDGVGHLVPDPQNLPTEWRVIFDRITNASRELQEEGYKDGFLSVGEKAKHPFHISLVRRHHKVQRGDVDKLVRAHVVNLKNPDGTFDEHVLFSTTLFPRLSDPALLPRRQSWDLVYEALERGELFDDPAEFYLHTLVNDHMLLNSYRAVRDMILDHKYILSAAEAEIKYTGKGVPVPPEWLDLNKMVTSTSKERLLRMLRKKLGNDSEEVQYVLGSLDEGKQVLPLMRAGAANKLFGDDGMFEQTKMAAGWLEALTTGYKSMKTGFNLPTHLQNTLGNTVFLAQAGMNPLSGKTWRLAGDITSKFREYTAAKRAGNELAWVNKNKDKMIKYEGFEIPFVDLIGYGKDAYRNHLAKDLLIESAFEFVEAFTHLERVYNRIDKDHRSLRGFVGTLLKIHDPSRGKRALTETETSVMKLFKEGVSTGDIAQKLGMTGKRVEDAIALAQDNEMSWAARKYKDWVTQNLSRMTGAYLAEDIIPKMMLMVKGMSDGLSFKSSLTEVGRRLPMYNTVGAAFKNTRRVWLPWVTFPSEALRITKNNIMDDPIRFLPWLKAPSILQSTAYSLGMTGDDESFESLEAAKRGIPLWAQQGPETIVYGGREGLAGSGALVSGTVGALGGGVTKGPLGAVLGGLIGGISGAGASYFLDRDGEQLRGAVLNWLPHSSFMMSELRAPDFTYSGVKDVTDVIPAEPLAILKPLLETLVGRDQYGNDMVTGGFGDSIKKTIAGYIGFMTPPIIQKYGYGTATPDVAAFGNEWTDGAIVASAAAVLGLAIQKKTGVPVFKGIGNVSKKSLGKAAIIGGLLGSTTDVSRIYTDTGISRDPYGREGTTAQDAFFNNIGLMRSYRSTPEQRIANEGLMKRHIQEVRSYLGRQLRFAAENGDDEMLGSVLKKIHVSFKAQYEDAALAQKRYGDFLEEYASSIGQHPSLKSLSKEELIRRIRLSSLNAEKIRGLSQAEMRNLLIRTRAEQIAKQAARRRR